MVLGIVIGVIPTFVSAGSSEGFGYLPSDVVDATNRPPQIRPQGLTQIPKPPVVSRIAWGCPDGEDSPAWPDQLKTTVTHLVIHHSDTPNSATDWKAVVRSIFSQHKIENGWGDIGYNYLIDPNGTIYEGRAGGDNVIGAHFSCANGRTMGVCLIGTFDTASPTTAARASLVQLLAWKAAQNGLDPKGVTFHPGTGLNLPVICGHRDGNAATNPSACPKGTVCPGQAFYSTLDVVRESVSSMISGSGPDTSRPTISAFEVVPTSLMVGQTARINYTVSDSGGSGLKVISLARNDVGSGEFDPNWKILETRQVSGDGPIAGFFEDTPALGTHWYGLQVSDAAGNKVDERAAGVGPDQIVVLGTACTYSVPPTPAQFGGAGGNGGFGVATSASCDWTASANVPWLHTSSSGRGSGGVEFTVDANPSASSRSGTISVGGQSYTVNQAPPDTRPPTLSITSPAPNANFLVPTIEVRGTASDAGLGDSGILTVTVNGLNASGAVVRGGVVASWQGTARLNPGANTITVVATDGAGNTTTKTVDVTYSTATSVLRLGSTLGSPGSAVSVPVTLESQGTETAIGFSLQFDPAQLSFGTFELGQDASGAQLVSNLNQSSNGRVGAGLSLGAGQTFNKGIRQVLVAHFTIKPTVTGTSIPVSFADSPVPREISDAAAAAVLSDFQGTSITVGPKGFEADVAPRPDGNGDGSVRTTDWVQVGRFAAGLDSPAPGSEFQRADCAPRASLGDGRITTTDWVQAGRYAAGLDPVASAGGPTAPVAGSSVNRPRPLGISDPREIRLGNVEGTSGGTVVVPIEIDAKGGENALGLSLQFDPSLIRFTSFSVVGRFAGAATILNSNNATAGKVGVVIALPAGTELTEGSTRVASVEFTVATSGAVGRIPIRFGDSPTQRELSNSAASDLPATWTDGSIMVPGVPPGFSLTVLSTNGTISVAPALTNYPAGTLVKLQAIASNGYEFEAWSGDAAGTINPIPVTMDGNKTVVASFRATTAATTNRLSAVSLDRTTLGATLNGTPEERFRIESSINLRDWTPVSTNTIPAEGFIRVSIPLHGGPRQFIHAVPLDSASMTLQPGPTDGKDIWTTSVYSYGPNGGSPGGGKNDEWLRVGGWGDLYYSLLEFDLTAAPKKATSAILSLYCGSISGGGTPMDLFQITEYWDWRVKGTGADRDRLWWADQPAASKWSASTLPVPSAGQWYSIDITELYNAWQSGETPNHGIELRPTQFQNNNFNNFYSSDYTDQPGIRPKLTITTATTAGATPQKVVGGLEYPDSVQASDGFLYFTDNPVDGGVLKRIAVTGGAPQLLASGLTHFDAGSFRPVANYQLDGDSVFGQFGGYESLTIFEVAKVGGSVLPRWTGSGGNFLGVHSKQLYYSMNFRDILQIALPSGSPQFVASGYWPRSTQIDPSSIYFYEYNSHSVLRLEFATSTISTLIKALPSEVLLRSDDASLFLLSPTGGGFSIDRVPKDGGAPVALVASGASGPLASDGTIMYYAALDRSIRALDLRTHSESIAVPRDFGSQITSITLDAGHLYWSDLQAGRGSGTIWSQSR